jgi:hypothetical protein
LDLDIKNRSNHKNNTKYKFPMPKCPRNHVLYSILSQTSKTLIFIMAVGDHFVFGAPKSYAHIFAKGIQAKVFI